MSAPLDVGRLRLLREVALRGSIAAAGRSLGLTPSAVSQQLAVLERETGTALLARSPRGAVLTDVGTRLAARSGDVLDLLEQTRSELDALTGRTAGVVRVAAVASAAAAVLGPAVSALSDPDVVVSVTVGEPAVSIEALVAGDVDLAVVDEYDYVPITVPPACSSVDLWTEPLHAVLPASRRWPRRVSLESLSRSPWVVPPDDAACGRAVRSACRAAGFEPDVRWETDDMWVLATTVAQGNGVTVLPRCAVAAVPGTVERPLAAPLSRRVMLLSRRAAAARPAVVAVSAAIAAASARR